MSWEAVKKKMFNVRENLSNEQQAQAEKIRDTSDEFANKVSACAPQRRQAKVCTTAHGGDVIVR